MRTLLRQACSRNEIRLLDLHIGLFLEKLCNGNQPELLLAATLASAAVGNGHTCLPLEQTAAFPLQLAPAFIPDTSDWRKNLLATPVVGIPGTTRPLILDRHNRLYLYRFFKYEEEIARDLRSRATGIMEVNQQQTQELLHHLFPDPDSSSDQQTAATLALLKRLLVISGGPGTGKTHTVARILALIQALHTNPLRIGLAAPTGKAAARLEDSIRRAKQSLPPELTQNIPEQALTLHRLLGYRPGDADFRYNRNNPLHIDLLVLDEASMIDVVLMAALLQALPERARLILLGDRNQLASVEAGSLFADLCGPAAPWSGQRADHLGQLSCSKTVLEKKAASTLAESVITLHTSYRFQKTSGIGSLAAAVNSGSIDQMERVLKTNFPDLDIQGVTGKQREQWLAKQIIHGFRDMLTASTVTKAFAAMEKFRFLCAVHRGPAGVEGINNRAELILRKAGFITEGGDGYQGKPIIIRRNHYEMQLFNGDTGILWNDENGQLRAWFRRPDNHLYQVAPARLPDHDTAYGITIHKAQGSKFDQVLLILPEKENRVLSRELLYTGITRARQRLILCCSRNILTTAIKQRTIRHSGLAEKLWGRPHS